MYLVYQTARVDGSGNLRRQCADDVSAVRDVQLRDRDLAFPWNRHAPGFSTGSFRQQTLAGRPDESPLPHPQDGHREIGGAVTPPLSQSRFTEHGLPPAC